MNTTPSQSLSFQSTSFALLSYYTLESDHYPQPLTKGQLLVRWLKTYPEQWVRWALIESLYQGRYKAYCVEQILALWTRRGQPLHHFNPEFEAMICNAIPERNEKVAETAETAEATVASLELEQSSILEDEASEMAAVLPRLSEASPEDLVSPSVLDADPVLKFGFMDMETTDYWADIFEQPSRDTRESILSSVLNNDQLLPLTLSRTGLVPIHRFMPEAEPLEFCERLAAIASASRA